MDRNHCTRCETSFDDVSRACYRYHCVTCAGHTCDCHCGECFCHCGRCIDKGYYTAPADCDCQECEYRRDTDTDTDTDTDMPLFRICWFDGELVEMRRAAGLRELVGELLDEWIDDPDICPLEVFGWLAAQGIRWGSPSDCEIICRTAAADAVRRALADSDVAVRLFLIACAGTLTCVERL